MLQHRFQNLIRLLLLLQLLLPSGAPWLHTLMEGRCCQVLSGPVQDRCARLLDQALHFLAHRGCCHAPAPRVQQDLPSQPQHDPHVPHDCSECAVCQAVAAPRMLAPLVELTAQLETVECRALIDCADPLPGFGLPLRCRSPPAAPAV